MSNDTNEEITREEIKKEFQLERMILFSDAVFAIVITLMAIEIKIPETVVLNDQTLPKALLHLTPTLLAYIVSFGFIGSIWYQHLKMFIILLCIMAQYLLYYYIVVKRPEIRLNIDITEHKNELYKRKVSLMVFSAAGILIVITYLLIPDPNMKSLSTLWMAAFSIVYAIIVKRKKSRLQKL